MRGRPHLVNLRSTLVVLCALPGVVGQNRDGAAPPLEIRNWGLEDGLPQSSINSIAETPDGYLWLATNGGLVRFDGVRFDVFDRANTPELPTNRFSQVLVDEEGSLLIKWWDGVLRRMNGHFVPESRDAWKLAYSRVGASVGEVDISIAPGAELPETLVDRLQDRLEGLKSIHRDRDGQSWCGTIWSGLYRVRRAAHELFLDDYGYRWCRFVSDGAGGLWIAPREQPHLEHFVDGKVVETLVGDPETPMTPVTGLHRARDGALWARHDRRITVYREGRSVVHDLGVGSPMMSPMIEAQDGSVWCGVEEALFRIGDDGVQRIRIAEEVAGRRVISLAAATDGTVWVGLVDAVLRWDGQGFETYHAEDGVPLGEVRAICEASDGSLWIGSYGGGVARTEGSRFVRFGASDGLPDNFISCILDDGLGNLWMNSNQGAFRVRRGAFAKVEPGTGAALPIELVDSGEAQGNGGSIEGNNLVFPTIDGLVAIDLTRALSPRRSAPEVYIEGLRAGSQLVELDASNVLPPDRRDLEFRYTAPDLLDPEGLRFKHRLNGYDTDWVQAGDRRQVRYTRVPYGSYSFEVVAISSNDRESKPATLTLTIEPFFHETLWFIGLIVATLGGLAFGVYRWRIRTVTAHSRELEAQVDLRTRAERSMRDLSQKLLTTQDEEWRSISRELHDHVTQRLAGLAIQAEVMAQNSDQASDLAGMAHELAKDVQELSRRLHPSSLGDLGLLRAMRSECHAFSKRMGIAVELEARGELPDLPNDVSLTVFRILQESLRNVEKHARASRVDVKLIAGDSELEVTISDVGRGFHINGQEPHAGIGLISMRERAHSISGELSVTSDPGAGTTVRLQVPMIERGT